MNNLTKTYTPESEQLTSFVHSWKRLFRNFIQYRGLIWQLFKRDFLATYKKSFLGYGWLFVSPILGVVSWIILNHAGVLKPGTVGVPYGIYVLIGTFIWTFFTGALIAASGTFTSSSSLITQVKYPHEVFLFKQLAQQLANFLISFVFVIGVAIFYGLQLRFQLFLFPLFLLPVYLFAVGLGLFLSLVSVVIADVTSAINYGLGFLIYLSPIIYSWDLENPALKKLFRWNPLTYLVCTPRDIILFGEISHVRGFTIASVLALLTFVFAWKIFCAAESQLVERMV